MNETNAVAHDGAARISARNAGQRAEETLRSHPFFAASVVAGVGVLVAGALVLRARHRRGLLEQLMHWF